MPTKKHRYMIVLDEDTIQKLNYIKKWNGRKQTSYIIKKIIDNEFRQLKEFLEEITNI